MSFAIYDFAIHRFRDSPVTWFMRFTSYAIHELCLSRDTQFMSYTIHELHNLCNSWVLWFTSYPIHELRYSRFTRFTSYPLTTKITTSRHLRTSYQVPRSLAQKFKFRWFNVVQFWYVFCVLLYPIKCIYTMRILWLYIASIIKILWHTLHCTLGGTGCVKRFKGQWWGSFTRAPEWTNPFPRFMNSSDQRSIHDNIRSHLLPTSDITLHLINSELSVNLY